MISNLRASLTKYGIIELLSMLQNNQVENYLNGSYTPGRVIDEPQFRALLGIGADRQLPSFWTEIRNYPNEMGQFCLVAVIFMHIDTINLFKSAGSQEFGCGIIRSDMLDRKGFTNLRGIIERFLELRPGAVSFDAVPYDFLKILASGEVGLLVKKLIINRLNKIGWNEHPQINEEFYRSFLEQCEFYEFNKVFNITTEQFRMWVEGQGIISGTEECNISFRRNWEIEEVKFDPHIVVSLAAKPFLIITGSSGTGKTYGIRKLAAELNPSSSLEFNMTFIAVEAGWKDGRHLIGHRNPFGVDGEIYQPTPLVNMLLKANFSAFKHIPFFVLFDEMNLSHVEMYFAKFLALMETARHRGLHSQPLLTDADLDLLLKYYKNSHEFTTYILEAKSNGGLFIPPNVFFVGTVNIDETTYMFSPKVLDRAFVIEKNTSLPSTLKNMSTNGLVKSSRSTLNAFLLGDEFNGFRQNLDGQEGFEKINMNEESIVIPAAVFVFLDSVYSILRAFPFGYRVVIECAEYVLKARQLHEVTNQSIPWLVDQNSLFDELLLQKVLPKVHGNRKQIGTTLNEIKNICVQDTQVLFPKTLSKVLVMEHNLLTVGYCGFVC